MQKFLNFINEAGAQFERQEREFIKRINSAVEENDGAPIVVKTPEKTIKGIISAGKYEGRSTSGTEPITDVVLTLKSGKTVNISMKGKEAPSLAGGGLRGISLILPSLVRTFMTAARRHLIKSGYEKGDLTPDIYAKISDEDALRLIIANDSVGGPIDFMYIGEMEIDSDFSDGVLDIYNGQLIPAETYAEMYYGQFYLRLRKRREDQPFDPDAYDKDGIPKVYGVSPSKGDSAGRIMVVNRVPSEAEIVKI